MAVAVKLASPIVERLQGAAQPQVVRDAMCEYVEAIVGSSSNVEARLGHQGWAAVEVVRNGRVVSRIFANRGLIKVMNFMTEAKNGDYGPRIALMKNGAWACTLGSEGVPEELYGCVADAIAAMDGRRGRVRPGFAAGVVDAGRRSSSGRSALPKSLRFAVLVRDDYTCRYCGRSAPDVVLHVDHLKPVAHGGADEMTNLATACKDCNLGKGARFDTTPAE